MFVSSANKIEKQDSDTIDRSVMYNRKRNGPRIDPCGTPQSISVESLREIKEYTNHTFTFAKGVSDFFN